MMNMKDLPLRGLPFFVQVDENGNTLTGSSVIGKVLSPTRIVDVTLSLDTNAYTSGDVLADTQVITGAFSLADGAGIICSLMVIDEDDQGAAFDLYFLDANVAMGTENSAPGITDTNARSLLPAVISIGTGDYKDLGGAKVAMIQNLTATVKAISGTANLAIAAVNGAGTPTYTASGLKLRIGILE